MEADHGQAPSRPQTGRGRIQKRFQILQLAVYGDPKGLKGSRRGMDSAVTGSSQNSRDRPSQIKSGRQWAGTDYRTGDRAGTTLLPVYIKDVRDLLFSIGIEDVRGRNRLTAIHPHIQRSFTHKREPPLGIVEHDGRNADVGQDSIHIQKTMRL